MTYLEWLSRETPGEWWVDSADLDAIDRALAIGATGVTMNPLLLARALAAGGSSTADAVAAEGELPQPGPERAVEITRRAALHISQRLLALYGESRGERGYVCAQVNPATAADAEAMVEQATRFASWAPNVLVKLPVTEAGVHALERCIGKGINITATVSFSLPQVVVTAEAHGRGAQAARASGQTPGRCYAVAMLGRLDDHLKRVVGGADAEAIDWAGIAVAKRAHELFARRGYEAFLLPSGMRHPGQVTELAGGRFVFSISPEMAEHINDARPVQESGLPAAVDEAVLEKLGAIPDFVRAYEPDGMEPPEFAGFGASVFTLQQFATEGWQVLERYPGQ